MKGQRHGRIAARIRIAALVCAAVPPLLFLALLLPVLLARPDSGGAADQAGAQVATPVVAQAAALQARFGSVESVVLAMRAYASEALGSPDRYGAPESQKSYISPGGAPKAAKPANPPAAPLAAEPPLDNTLLYSKGPDGALRKLLDDGRPAVFFQARSDGQFTTADKQRLYASAALDPLLKQAGVDPLVGLSYLLTGDGLLRAYPYRDFSGTPGGKDFSKLPMYAWSKDKANSRGVLWTAPYASAVSGTWVVACITGVSVAGKPVGVVGCEVELKRLQQDAFSFPLGPGAQSWLQRPDGLLVAAPAGADAVLGVEPLGSEPALTKGQDGNKTLESANLYLHGRPELVHALPPKASQTEHVETQLDDSRYLISEPVEGTGLVLGAILASPELELVQAQRAQTSRLRLAVLRAALCALLAGFIIALAAAWLLGRSIAEPLRLLTQRVREITSRRTKGTVAIYDESEVGALSDAVQDLVDTAEFPPV